MTLNGKSINAQESLHGGRLLVRLQTQSRLRVEQGGRVAAGAVADGAGWSSLPTSRQRHCPPSVSGTTHGHSGSDVSVKKRRPPKIFARAECSVPERCIYSVHLCAESMR